MKVLLTGATGTIGSSALTQCLAHPQITTVIAFTRRPLPASISAHPKLQTVHVTDFSKWTPDLLDQHMDAAAMIWALGSLYGDPAADYTFPLEFQKAFIKRRMEREASGGVTMPPVPFTYVQLSGKFVRQDQDKWLFFLDGPRKLKGLLETDSIALAEKADSSWRLVVPRPGVVMTDGFGTGVLTAILGENWAINVDCLGAYLAYLAVGGEAEGPIVYPRTIARKGKELLAAAAAT